MSPRVAPEKRPSGRRATVSPGPWPPGAAGARGGVTGQEPAGGAGEAAVREEGDRLAEALADEGRGNAEHLAHPGSSAGALVPDHDDVPGHDGALLHGRHGIFLRLEDAGRAAVMQACVAGDLDHASLRAAVALEDPGPPRAPARGL